MRPTKTLQRAMENAAFLFGVVFTPLFTLGALGELFSGLGTLATDHRSRIPNALYAVCFGSASLISVTAGWIGLMSIRSGGFASDKLKRFAVFGTAMGVVIATKLMVESSWDGWLWLNPIMFGLALGIGIFVFACMLKLRVTLSET